MKTNEEAINLEWLDSLEDDLHLFELFISDYIENQVQRLMEMQNSNQSQDHLLQPTL